MLYWEGLREYKRTLLSTKAVFYNNRILQAANTQKEIFRVFEELSHAKNLTKAPQNSQEDFNELHAFFLNKIEVIREEIAKSSLIPGAHVMPSVGLIGRMEQPCPLGQAAEAPRPLGLYLFGSLLQFYFLWVARGSMPSFGLKIIISGY